MIGHNRCPDCGYLVARTETGTYDAPIPGAVATNRSGDQPFPELSCDLTRKGDPFPTAPEDSLSASSRGRGILLTIYVEPRPLREHTGRNSSELLQPATAPQRQRRLLLLSGFMGAWMT